MGHFIQCLFIFFVVDSGTALSPAHSQMLPCILQNVLVVSFILPTNAFQLVACKVLLIILRKGFIAFGSLDIHEVLFP